MIKILGLVLAFCLVGLTPALGQTPPPTEPMAQEAMPDTVIIPAPMAPSVQVQALAAPDVFSPGARDTGLGPDVWSGSAADLARDILPQIGKTPLSPAGMAMARRLLATGANAPDGASEDLDLASARLRALLALGDAAGVESMLERTPGANYSPALAQLQAEVALILGQYDKACQGADAVSSNRDDPYWLRLRSYCQAINGQIAAAGLTFGLAQSQRPDPVFGLLMGHLLNGGHSKVSASLRNGLDLALSRTLGLDLTPTIMAAPAPIVITLASDANTPQGLRLMAARQAMRFGAKVAEVYDLANAQPMPSGLNKNADLAIPVPLDLSGLIKLQGAAAEARLLAIGRDTNDWGQRDQIVTNLLKRGDSLADFMAMARLTAPLIAELAKANAPVTAPVLLATAAVVTGDVETGLALRQSLPAGMATDEVLVLDALLTLAKGPTDPDRDAVLERLSRSTRMMPGQGTLSRRQSAVLLTAALTAQVPPAVRTQLARLDTGKLDTSAARLFALDLAADQQLKAETILSALAILNTSGSQGPRLNERVRIVRSLGLVGLGPDATALAMEGLIIAQGYTPALSKADLAKMAPPAKPKPKPRPKPKPKPASERNAYLSGA